MSSKNNLLFIIAFSLLLFSCKEKTIDVEYGEAKILSFGFYVADNVGVIAKDYVVTDVQSKSITINLPGTVNKTKLKARFTTSANDTVSVEGIIQTSGVTANDFSFPVDYILFEGITHSRFTVTIGKASEYIWTKVPAFVADSAISAIMRVNPTNGVPYILFKESRSESVNQKAGMVRFENGAWVNMGDASDGQIGSYFELAFNATGKPYISYADYTAPVAQMNTVKTHNGSAWDLVGNKGVTSNKVSYSALAFSPAGNLMLFSMFDATTGPLARRELCISTFNGSAWTTNQTMPGRSSDQVAYYPTTKLVNGVLYLAILNAISPNSLSVYKYTNGSWTTLLDKWKDPASTAMSLRDFDMDVDLLGNIYVAFVDNSSDGATLKQRIIKYSASTGTVSSVGNPIIGATGGLFNFDLAISPTGIPYFLYKNLNSYPVISYFDNDSQQWSEPYLFETESIGDLYLDFTTNGDAYVSYTKNRKLIMYKYAQP